MGWENKIALKRVTSVILLRVLNATWTSRGQTACLQVSLTNKNFGEHLLVVTLRQQANSVSVSASRPKLLTCSTHEVEPFPVQLSWHHPVFSRLSLWSRVKIVWGGSEAVCETNTSANIYTVEFWPYEPSVGP